MLAAEGDARSARAGVFLSEVHRFLLLLILQNISSMVLAPFLPPRSNRIVCPQRHIHENLMIR